jgi:homospermidine synthase
VFVVFILNISYNAILTMRGRQSAIQLLHLISISVATVFHVPNNKGCDERTHYSYKPCHLAGESAGGTDHLEGARRPINLMAEWLEMGEIQDPKAYI